MENAVWMASIFGPMLAILGLWGFVRFHDMDTYWTSIKASPSMMICGGMFNLIIGIIVLNFYHAWQFDWTLLVTLYGYTSFIRGLLFLFYTKPVTRFADHILRHKHARYLSLIPLVWGLALVCFSHCHM